MNATETTIDDRPVSKTPATRPTESEIMDMFTGWGRRVCEARVKAGLTQTQLAGLTQVAPGTIGRVEAGTLGEPTIQIRMALDAALGVRVEDLFPFPAPRPVVVHDRGQTAALDGLRPLNR